MLTPPKSHFGLIVNTLFACLVYLSVISEAAGKLSSRLNGFQFAADYEDVIGVIHNENFSCEGRPYGYYADQNLDCKVFHICSPIPGGNGRRVKTLMFSFFCPERTIFSQDSKTCTTVGFAYSCLKAHTLYSQNEAFGKVPTKGQQPSGVSKNREVKANNEIGGGVSKPSKSKDKSEASKRFKFTSSGANRLSSSHFTTTQSPRVLEDAVENDLPGKEGDLLDEKQLAREADSASKNDPVDNTNSINEPFENEGIVKIKDTVRNSNIFTVKTHEEDPAFPENITSKISKSPRGKPNPSFNIKITNIPSTTKIPSTVNGAFKTITVFPGSKSKNQDNISQRQQILPSQEKLPHDDVHSLLGKPVVKPTPHNQASVGRKFGSAQRTTPSSHSQDANHLEQNGLEVTTLEPDNFGDDATTLRDPELRQLFDEINRFLPLFDKKDFSKSRSSFTPALRDETEEDAGRRITKAPADILMPPPPLPHPTNKPKNTGNTRNSFSRSSKSNNARNSVAPQKIEKELEADIDEITTSLPRSKVSGSNSVKSNKNTSNLSRRRGSSRSRANTIITESPFTSSSISNQEANESSFIPDDNAVTEEIPVTTFSPTTNQNVKSTKNLDKTSPKRGNERRTTPSFIRSNNQQENEFSSFTNHPSITDTPSTTISSTTRAFTSRRPIRPIGRGSKRFINDITSDNLPSAVTNESEPSPSVQTKRPITETRLTATPISRNGFSRRHSNKIDLESEPPNFTEDDNKRAKTLLNDDETEEFSKIDSSNSNSFDTTKNEGPSYLPRKVPSYLPRKVTQIDSNLFENSLRDPEKASAVKTISSEKEQEAKKIKATPRNSTGNGSVSRVRKFVRKVDKPNGSSSQNIRRSEDDNYVLKLLGRSAISGVNESENAILATYLNETSSKKSEVSNDISYLSAIIKQPLEDILLKGLRPIKGAQLIRKVVKKVGEHKRNSTIVNSESLSKHSKGKSSLTRTTKNNKENSSSTAQSDRARKARGRRTFTESSSNLVSQIQNSHLTANDVNEIYEEDNFIRNANHNAESLFQPEQSANLKRIPRQRSFPEFNRNFEATTILYLNGGGQTKSNGDEKGAKSVATLFGYLSDVKSHRPNLEENEDNSNFAKDAITNEEYIRKEDNYKDNTDEEDKQNESVNYNLRTNTNATNRNYTTSDREGIETLENKPAFSFHSILKEVGKKKADSSKEKEENLSSKKKLRVVGTSIKSSVSVANKTVSSEGESSKDQSSFGVQSTKDPISNVLNTNRRNYLSKRRSIISPKRPSI